MSAGAGAPTSQGSAQPRVQRVPSASVFSALEKEPLLPLRAIQKNNGDGVLQDLVDPRVR